MVCVTQCHSSATGTALGRQHQGLCRAGRGSGGSQELLLPPESSDWAVRRDELVFSGTFRGNEVTTWSLFENKTLFASQKSLGKCLQHPCPLLPAPLLHPSHIPAASPLPPCPGPGTPLPHAMALPHSLPCPAPGRAFPGSECSPCSGRGVLLLWCCQGDPRPCTVLRPLEQGRDWGVPAPGWDWRAPSQ